ncbi:MAG TPA: DoxX family protein [Verrucomicrobiae bacterium]|jgi:putative oxidoreductase
MNTVKSTMFVSLYNVWVKTVSCLQSPLLLVIRLYWGWQFFETGKGKLMNLDKTAGFFESIHIPLPHLNAVLAGSTECFGGLLLALGLGARIITVPLVFTMCIAYATAESEAVHAIFSDPDKFVTAAPFEFMLAALIVLIFGPGKFSVDYLIRWKYFDKQVKV